MSENNQAFRRERFCDDVLDSELNPVEKIRKLSAIPDGCPDIVEEMLKFGPYLENYFEAKSVFYNEENVIDFIGGTIVYFEAIEKCIKELSEDESYKELYKANKKYVMGAETAVSLANRYFALFDIWDNKSGTAEEFQREAEALVELCAEYFEATHVLHQNDIVYYRFGQKSLIENFIRGSQEYSSESSSQKEEAAPSEPKKSFAPLVWIIGCGAVCLTLCLVSLITKNSLFNYVLAGTGVLELVIAVVLFLQTSKKELYTCPECGGKRKEIHRKYLNTTKHEKFFEYNPNKTVDESIEWIYSYTHHYLSTYTCMKCGRSVEKNTTDGGGCLTSYYSHRRKDTRTDPREF